ncbi:MAG: hypothetical protein N4A76_00930 [Firmicutes bacterium]|jgi:hypothetical protein|nr:hypothetical protein [Bacillota bacterium]
MNKFYYVNTNAQNTGEHEVHAEGCNHMPSISNREYLGYFDSCKDALREARNKGYDKVDGCFYCANECHIK